jgi:hypothetical protein
MLIIFCKCFFPDKEQPRFEKVVFVPALLLLVVSLLRVTKELVLSRVGKGVVFGVWYHVLVKLGRILRGNAVFFKKKVENVL